MTRQNLDVRDFSVTYYTKYFRFTRVLNSLALLDVGNTGYLILVFLFRNISDLYSSITKCLSAINKITPSVLRDLEKNQLYCLGFFQHKLWRWTWLNVHDNISKGLLIKKSELGRFLIIYVQNRMKSHNDSEAIWNFGNKFEATWSNATKRLPICWLW